MSTDYSQRFRIDQAAADHLKKKNKPFATIEYPDYRTTGESVFIEVPEIANRVPKEELKYHHLVIDGIDVYLRRDVKLPEEGEIVIGLDSFLGVKFLKVSGFNAKEYSGDSE